MTKGIANRFGWLMVLGATLTMSDYSLYFVARHLGTPPVFAILGGVIFDGAALVFADYSLKHARAGSSGSGPRLGVIICAGLSAYLNSLHAVIAHQITPARIFWAAPPIIAVAAYEFHIRWERRRALANAGRIAPDLPVMGKWAWLLFPIRTIKLARTVVRYRMGLTLIRNTPGMVHVNPPFPVPDGLQVSAGTGVSGVVSQNSGVVLTNSGLVLSNSADLRELLAGETQQVRQWAKARGYSVNQRGPIPADVLREYAVSIVTPELGETPEEYGENPEETPGEITGEDEGKVNGHAF